MGFIDIAIPAIGGILCFLLPIKETGFPEQDEKKRRMLRICGVVLLVVAAGYLMVKLLQGSV